MKVIRVGVEFAKNLFVRPRGEWQGAGGKVASV
jgi:hypothetical protein